MNLVSRFSCLLFCYVPTVLAYSRLQLNGLSIGIGPFSRMLTNEETGVLAQTVQMLLETYLSRNSPDKISTPDNWAAMTSLTLTRVLENSLSDEGVVKVTVGGMAYFFVSGDEIIPTKEEFLDWTREEVLIPDILLETIKATSIGGELLFQNATRASLWQDFFTNEPTVAPTIATAFPTVAPKIATASPSIATSNPTVQEGNTAAPSQQINTAAPSQQISSEPQESAISSSTQIGTWVGIVLGAAIGVLLMILLAFCCYKRKKKRESNNQQGGKSNATDSPNSKTVCSDDESSFRVHKPLNFSETNQSPQKSRRLFGFNSSDKNKMEEPMSDDGSSFGSFDEEDGFDKNTRTIQPHIVVPKQTEELHQQHTVIKIQKDMLESSASTKAKTAHQPKSLLGLPPFQNSQNTCVLEPTDMSAASLAVAGLSMEPKRMSHTSSWLKESKEGESEEESFGGWDPDDASSSAASDADTSFASKIPNPAEQSLLQHSVRNESYKLQRLRTPEYKQNR